jgi:hypothetical protein
MSILRGVVGAPMPQVNLSLDALRERRVEFIPYELTPGGYSRADLGGVTIVLDTPVGRGGHNEKGRAVAQLTHVPAVLEMHYGWGGQCHSGLLHQSIPLRVRTVSLSVGLVKTIAKEISGRYHHPMRAFLSLDDGVTEDLEIARLLAQRGASATFMVSSPERTSTAKSRLSWEDLRLLLDGGHTLGCHTRSHLWLPRLSLPELEWEIPHFRDELERKLGIRVTAFAYPYGLGFAEDASLLARWGFSVGRGAFVGAHSSPFHTAPDLSLDEPCLPPAAAGDLHIIGHGVNYTGPPWLDPIWALQEAGYEISGYGVDRG